MTLREFISSQCGRPRGPFGRVLASLINLFNRRLYSSVTRALLEKQSKEILDIGFGNGFLEKRLSTSSELNIKGIDISSDMVFIATRRNKRAIRDGRLTLSLGDSFSLCFSDNTFNSVVSINTSYFWPDINRSLSEIKRVLKEGGVFINAVYSEEYLKRLPYTRSSFNFFSKEDYADLGRRAGFSSVELEELERNRSYLIKYTK